ncbi:MAG: extracellular solute-binding protein [bacterium]
MRRSAWLVAVVFLAVLLLVFSVDAAKKKIVFQTFFGAGQKETDEGHFAQEVRKAFPDWDFSIQWFTYAAYAEKLNLQIASGDLPDMTVVDTNIQLPRMVDEDMVISLDDLLNKYGQNILKYTPPWHWDACTYDGKKMAIINGWTTKIWGPYMRKDWLDNLGLAVPNTLDEFYKVAQRFTFNDPDGNGKNDTFGTGFREGVNWFDHWFHAFGVAPGHHHTGIWRRRGGRVEIDWVQPQMLDALKFIRKMYQEGLIIPESVTFDGTQWEQAFTSGRFGIYYHGAGTLQNHTFAEGEVPQGGAGLSRTAPGPRREGVLRRAHALGIRHLEDL